MTTTTRLALGGAAVILSIAGAIWLVLSSIEPATYATMEPGLTHAIFVLLWVAAVGQTSFVCLWLTLPWYRLWIGRALMVKSLALAIYLDFALVVHYLRPFAALPLLAVILFGFITVGIWSQLGALALEVTRARRRHQGR